MVARARDPLESFPRYKENLKEEAAILKFKLKPKMLRQSTGLAGLGTYVKARDGSLK
jgi:hypothetical protein